MTARRLEVVTALGVLVVDQATKALIRVGYDLYESTTLVPGFANITRVHNTGAAFGMLNEIDLPMKTALLAVVATAALFGLGAYAASLPPEQRITRYGLALILGGAAGNLVDRLTLGFVVDFIDVYFGTWHFWAFNVADAAISVGVALMLLEMLGMGRRVPGTA